MRVSAAGRPGRWFTTGGLAVHLVYGHFACNRQGGARACPVAPITHDLRDSRSTVMKCLPLLAILIMMQVSAMACAHDELTDEEKKFLFDRAAKSIFSDDWQKALDHLLPDSVFGRFVKENPVAVMVRRLLYHVLIPASVDAHFERYVEKLYSR